MKRIVNSSIVRATVICTTFAFVGCSLQDMTTPVDSPDDASTQAGRRPPGTPPGAPQPPQNAMPTGDDRLAGGATTVFLTNEDAFNQAAPNLSAASLRLHDAGDSSFGAEFFAVATATRRGGLGPIFNHTSCEGCHIGDGRGHPVAAAGEMNTLLLRLSQFGRDAHGAPLAVAGFGGQLQDQAVSGVQPEGKFVINYTEQPGTFADGTPYSLRMPRYVINNTYTGLPSNIQVSPRIASPVFGLGLLEAVSEQTILSFADPDDSDRDGISGKPNYVWNVQTQSMTLGRFGWKANQPSLTQQNAAAFNGDMGVTTTLFPTESSAGQLQAIPAHAPEVGDAELAANVHYTRTLGVPARRNTQDPAVQRGKELFGSARCNACHTPSMRTGVLPNVPEVSNQTIYPYTDMLLHDVGEGLTDNRPDFAANGREWRTSPLWGIGLTHTVNKHTLFLHDGRARNLTEAILWHGGEATASRESFRRMSKSERDALLAFLESL